MYLRTESFGGKTLAGKRIQTSFLQHDARSLWQSFMPLRVRIEGVGHDLYSVEIYPPGFFEAYDPSRPFEKWAAAEAASGSSVPVELETLTIPAGLYAVFLHRGPASAAPATFQWIFTKWLPASGFAVDDRPHFEVMGPKYRADSPDSEEELWVPIRGLQA